MLSTLKKNLINIPGWKTNRKIVVIESDDWGSIRMPSKKVFTSLQKQNLYPEDDPYLKYDSLATGHDMAALYEVLNSVKDNNNAPAILTTNTVMGNPDFNRIKASNYEKYFWEPFTKTWEKYINCKETEETWLQGQEEGLVKFQCHGREHLNVDQWMKSLREGNKNLRKAFDLEMISISSQASELRFGYMEGLDFFSIEEQQNKKIILEQALKEFQKYFGFQSKSFIANCYIWDDFVEKILSENGVKFIQGIRNQIKPQLKNGDHIHKYIMHYTGQKNKFGQHYLVRNAFFEPSLDPSKDWVADCLKRINISFIWGKPAIIGSHRLNFIGAIHEENRTKNLKLFKRLLLDIVKLWPDVEFKSSDEIFTT